MTVLGSITDILVTEFGVSFPPASFWAAPGWEGAAGWGRVIQKEQVPTATQCSRQHSAGPEQRGRSRAPRGRVPAPQGGELKKTGVPKTTAMGPVLQHRLPGPIDL